MHMRNVSESAPGLEPLMDKIRAEPSLLDTVDGTLKERVFQNPEPENTTSTALDQKRTCVT